jgi:hypothetical protein
MSRSFPFPVRSGRDRSVAQQDSPGGCRHPRRPAWVVSSQHPARALCPPSPSAARAGVAEARHMRGVKVEKDDDLHNRLTVALGRRRVAPEPAVSQADQSGHQTSVAGVGVAQSVVALATRVDRTCSAHRTGISPCPTARPRRSAYPPNSARTPQGISSISATARGGGSSWPTPACSPDEALTAWRRVTASSPQGPPVGRFRSGSPELSNRKRYPGEHGRGVWGGGQIGCFVRAC